MTKEENAVRVARKEFEDAKSNLYHKGQALVKAMDANRAAKAKK